MAEIKYYLNIRKMEKYSKYNENRHYTAFIGSITNRLLENLDSIKTYKLEKERLERELKYTNIHLFDYMRLRDKLIEELNSQNNTEELNPQRQIQKNRDMYIEIIEKEEERLNSKLEFFREISSIEILRK